MAAAKAFPLYRSDLRLHVVTGPHGILPPSAWEPQVKTDGSSLSVGRYASSSCPD